MILIAQRARQFLWRLCLLIFISLTLAACGGGGDSTSISVNPKSLSFNSFGQAGPQTELVTAKFNGSGVVVGFPPGVQQPSWLFIGQSGNVTSDNSLDIVGAN